jgi:transcriptional regulator with XRE-family HTH domain
VVQRDESIDVSPAVLVWARRSIGLEQGEAADVAGVQLDDLRGWESGATMPTLADLVALARAYQRPLAALLLSEPPGDEGGVVDFRRRRGYQPPRMSPGAFTAEGWFLGLVAKPS